MKKLLCKFANWILRRCTSEVITFQDEIYINGRTYKLLKATTEISPHTYTVIHFEVIDEKCEIWEG